MNQRKDSNYLTIPNHMSVLCAPLVVQTTKICVAVQMTALHAVIMTKRWVQISCQIILKRVKLEYRPKQILVVITFYEHLGSLWGEVRRLILVSHSSALQFFSYLFGSKTIMKRLKIEPPAVSFTDDVPYSFPWRKMTSWVLITT